jgi:putative membrane protein
VARPAHSTMAMALVLGVLGACGTSRTGREAAVTVPADAPASDADRAWLTATHQDDLADVQYGGLAQRKGVTAAVRHAGRVLAAEHAALDAKLLHVANALGAGLPRSQRAGQLAVAQRLEKEAGSRFDRDFVNVVIDAHEKALARTEEEVRGGSSPAVIALARTALPALREHLTMLRGANPVG